MERMHKVALENEYFTLFELTEGVYAAVEKEKNTGSNAGFIDLGDRTVVFDTFLNIDAARALKHASEKLTGRTPSFVVNSHFHTDHFVGNCLFPEETTIISSEQARETIAKAQEEFAAEKDQYGPRITEIHTLLESGNHSNILDLQNELQFLTNLVKPGVELRVPDLAIEKGMVLYGSKRKVHLKAFEIAHSPGDIIAYLPEDRICFMGDLLSNHSHAWLGSGNPERFMEVLDEILSYDIQDYVSGHGQLSSRADVIAQRQYIEEMVQLVKTKKSDRLEDYSTHDLSPLFRDWKSLCFTWNINFLIERMKNSDTHI